MNSFIFLAHARHEDESTPGNSPRDAGARDKKSLACKNCPIKLKVTSNVRQRVRKKAPTTSGAVLHLHCSFMLRSHTQWTVSCVPQEEMPANIGLYNRHWYNLTISKEGQVTVGHSGEGRACIWNENHFGLEGWPSLKLEQKRNWMPAARIIMGKNSEFKMWKEQSGSWWQKSKV